MNLTKKEKYVGAMLGASIGDALGWPNEQNSRNKNGKQQYIKDFVKWTRKCGGKYWPYEEQIGMGEYSDDTQLLIATLRSLLMKNNWSSFFRNVELPAWVFYERGGGGATKRAAKQWQKNIAPWDATNEIKMLSDYYSAGGNGVAMRIMPHVFNQENDIDTVMKQVVLNGMYTHGHPRALIGALIYAYSLWFIFSFEGTLGYGQLIEELIENAEVWGKLPSSVSNINTWKENAKKYLQMEYDQLWETCVEETMQYLKIAREGIRKGILDMGSETLTQLGCFDKAINGAGNVAAVIVIYLFSKFASNPQSGLFEAVNLKNTDTDTIGSMLGGLLGALYGENWIPIELKAVQDYGVFEYLISQLLDNKQDILDETKKYRVITNKLISELHVGESIEVLPFGTVELVEIRNEKTYLKNIYAMTYVCKTKYGQTIFVTKLGKSGEKYREDNYIEDKKNGQLSINKENIKEVTRILKNVNNVEDFSNILYDFMTTSDYYTQNANEAIAELKQKWKKYKLTKKQIEILYRNMKV